MLIHDVVLFLLELYLIAIVHVGHDPPRRLSLDVTLFGGHAKFRGSLLKLDSVATSEHGGRNQPSRYLDVAVVIETDFGDNETRLPFTNEFVSDLNSGCHKRISKDSKAVKGEV
jgi:hypothetical protein